MNRLGLSITFIWFSLSMHSQSVIINEISQGSDGNKEWIELLVVADGVDLRNWDLGDNDDGTWDNLVTFADVPAWQNVRSGTHIVIYNQNDVDGTIILTGGEDTDFFDFSVIIKSTNPAFFSGGYGSIAKFNNSDSDDAAAIRDATDIIIHDMVVSHPVPTVPAPEAGEVKFFTGNSALSTNTNANWTTAASTAGTPGQPNGGANTIWINSLRYNSTVALPVALWPLLIVFSAIFLYISKKY